MTAGRRWFGGGLVRAVRWLDSGGRWSCVVGGGAPLGTHKPRTTFKNNKNKSDQFQERLKENSRTTQELTQKMN